SRHGPRALERFTDFVGQRLGIAGEVCVSHLRRFLRFRSALCFVGGPSTLFFPPALFLVSPTFLRLRLVYMALVFSFLSATLIFVAPTFFRVGLRQLPL